MNIHEEREIIGKMLEGGIQEKASDIIDNYMNNDNDEGDIDLINKAEDMEVMKDNHYRIKLIPYYKKYLPEKYYMISQDDHSDLMYNLSGKVKNWKTIADFSDNKSVNKLQIGSIGKWTILKELIGDYESYSS